MIVLPSIRAPFGLPDVDAMKTVGNAVAHEP